MFVIGCFWGKFLSAKEKSSGSFNFGSSQTSSSAAMFRFRVEFILSNCCTKEACRTCRADHIGSEPPKVLKKVLFLALIFGKALLLALFSALLKVSELFYALFLAPFLAPFS